MDQVRAIIETNCSTVGITLRGRLLKRLGIASLGYADGKPYWFLHLREPDEDGEWDIDEFETCDAAVRALQAKDEPELYAVFGPVMSTRDDGTMLPFGAAASVAPVVPMVPIETPLEYVLLMFKDTSRPPVQLDATQWDAVFWGPSSVAKFAIPYYVAASGLKYGVKVHGKFYGKTLQGEPLGDQAFALVHEPDTEYTVHVLPKSDQEPQVPTELPR